MTGAEARDTLDVALELAPARIHRFAYRGKASDVVSAEGADDFLAVVPHARFADVAGAGHMVAGDRNDAFNDAVLGFLREVFA